MQEYEIEFYDKADGSEPAKEFILSLDKKMQAKVLRTVALLREEGPFLREPYSKALDDGILKFVPSLGRILPACCISSWLVKGDPHKWIYQKDPENTCFRDHTGKTISRRLSCPKGELQMTNFNDF